MRFIDLLRFAVGGLRGHRLRTSLSLLGVAIGVGSVILLTSLGEGARRYIIGEFASLGSNLLIIVPGKTETAGFAPLVSTAPHDLTLQDAEALVLRVPPFGALAPLVVGTAAAGRRAQPRSDCGWHHPRNAGNPSHEDEQRPLSAGERAGRRGMRSGLAGAAGAVSGENPLGQLVRIGDWRFRVIGVIAPRGTSIGMDLDEVVEIPVDTGLRLFNRTSLFRILAEVGSHRENDQARREVINVLRSGTPVRRTSPCSRRTRF